MPAAIDPPSEPGPPAPGRGPVLTLPGLIMQRAAWVAVLVLALALAMGLWRMADDIDDEVDAAMTLATAMAQLGHLARTDDRSALAALAALQAEHPLRHLVLGVHAADGRALLPPPAAPDDGLLWGGLLRLHARLGPEPASRHAAWPVARPDGSAWTVTLTASPDSERREAMANLLDMLALLLACVAGLLLVMRWNLRRALRPLEALLASIAGIEAHNTQPVRALPAMPVVELQTLAAALRHLGEALEAAEAQRRQLSRQVLSLQEDERARLARELHDEFGQRLTAMRVDAAWLARRLRPGAAGADPQALAVVQGLAEQCQLIQQDVRQVLVRLQPLGRPGPAQASGAAAGPDQGEAPARLAELLAALVASWQDSALAGASAGGGLQVRLRLEWQARDDGPVGAWPDGADRPARPAAAEGPDRAEPPLLPHALALTLYRISQEALTNVARHAQAREAELCVRVVGDWAPGAAWRIDWGVADDGVGLPERHRGAEGSAGDRALQRGNGLAGLRERVWSHGADLQRGPGLHGRGLRLWARLQTTALASGTLALGPAAGPDKPVGAGAAPAARVGHGGEGR